jgi:uncharacterized membrane protein
MRRLYKLWLIGLMLWCSGSLVAGHLSILPPPVGLSTPTAGGELFHLVKDCSADGREIVGSWTAADGAPQPVIWQRSAAGGYVGKRLPTAGQQGAVLAMTSQRGYIIADLLAQDGLPKIYYWARQKQTLTKKLIGSGRRLLVTAIATEAPIAVGSQASRAFRWDKTAGFEFITASRGKGHTSEATATSPDGQVVVGSVLRSGKRRAFIWQRQQGLQLLPLSDTAAPFAKAMGVDAAAQTVVGAVMTSKGLRAALWQGTERKVRVLPVPANVQAAMGLDVSADGTRILGEFHLQGSAGERRRRPFIWTENRGVVAFDDLLAAEDRQQVKHWRQIKAVALTADGRHIIGEAVDKQQRKQLFVLHRPNH